MASRRVHQRHAPDHAVAAAIRAPMGERGGEAGQHRGVRRPRADALGDPGDAAHQPPPPTRARKPRPLREHRGLGVFREEARPAGGGETGGAARILQQLADRLGQRARILDRAEQPVASVVDQLARPVRGGGDPPGGRRRTPRSPRCPAARSATGTPGGRRRRAGRRYRSTSRAGARGRRRARRRPAPPGWNAPAPRRQSPRARRAGAPGRVSARRTPCCDAAGRAPAPPAPPAARAAAPGGRRAGRARSSAGDARARAPRPGASSSPPGLAVLPIRWSQRRKRRRS